jgi:hypothetical protein
MGASRQRRAAPDHGLKTPFSHRLTGGTPMSYEIKQTLKDAAAKLEKLRGYL